MTVAFDENVQERDCVVLFKFNSEFDVCVTVIEVVQKLSCCVFTVKQVEGIVNVPKPKRRASVVVKNPFLFKMAPKDIFTLEKQNIDCMTEKLNILKRSRVTVMRLLSQTTPRQLVTT